MDKLQQTPTAINKPTYTYTSEWVVCLIVSLIFLALIGYKILFSSHSSKFTCKFPFPHFYCQEVDTFHSWLACLCTLRNMSVVRPQALSWIKWVLLSYEWIAWFDELKGLLRIHFTLSMVYISRLWLNNNVIFGLL